MRMIATLSGVLLLATVVLHQNSEQRQQKLQAKQALLKYVDDSLWKNVRAEIPSNHREDFHILIRAMLTEDEQSARQAAEDFHQKVFPKKPKEQAFVWAMALDFDDELASGYKLLLSEIEELK